MFKLRKVFFWLHLAAGLLAGLIILVMSVTGVLLTYERQLIANSDAHLKSVPQPGTERAGVEVLARQIMADQPDVAVNSVTIGAELESPVQFGIGSRTLFVDAWSGQKLGEAAPGTRALMSQLRAWHRWLAVEGEQRPLAKAITGWANIIFAGLAITGLYLWFPRNWSWSRVRAVIFFRRGVRGKVRDFNWHNVIGFWSTVPLLIVVLSAVPISFPWASQAIYRAFGETPPPARGAPGGATARERGPAANQEKAPAGPAADLASGRGNSIREVLAGMDGFFRIAQGQVPGWRTISLRVPDSVTAPLVFTIDKGNGGQPQLRSTLTLSRPEGKVQSLENFEDQSPARKTRSLMRFAHTGEVMGLPGQTLAGLASLGGVILVWTGFALSGRRFMAWRRRRSAAESNPATAAGE